ERPERFGIWDRVAGLVSRHTRRVWIGVTVVLIALAAMLPLFRADGVSQTELFLQEVESVEGQDALDRHFPGGAGSPAVVVADQSELDAVLDVVSSDDGVEAAQPVTQDSESGESGPP